MKFYSITPIVIGYNQIQEKEAQRQSCHLIKMRSIFNIKDRALHFF